MITTITIHLIAGRNYISFPAISSDSFDSIFTTSGIKAYIIDFFIFDPILNSFPKVNYYEYIQRGRGYILDMITFADITYIGDEYILSFDEMRSRLIEGWNLVGPGSIPISLSNWCRVTDANTGFAVNQLQPQQAYWINYNSCQIPIVEPLFIVFGAGLIVSIISLWVALKGKKTESIID